MGNSKVIEWLENAQTHIMEQLDQLKDLCALYKNEMQPSQVICIQIGMKNYEAKLEMITEGLVRLRNLENEKRD